MSKQLSPEETVVGCIHLSIGDGGVSISILDHNSKGPVLRIESSHYGNNHHQQDVMITAKGVRQIADLFAKAQDHVYSGEYVYPARVWEGSGVSGSVDVDGASEYRGNDQMASLADVSGKNN